MRYQRVNGKMTRVEECSKVITWNFPEPIVSTKKATKDIHIITNSSKQKDVVAKSSLLAAASGLVMMNASGISVEAGLFWSMFMEYIYPWFVDLATVYAAIRIAMAFYEEQRGGRDSKNGFSSFVSYGKWLLLFHLIPFIVKLIDTVGQKMADSLA